MKQQESNFDFIYNKHWCELYAFAFNVVRDRALAQDIVQEVFVDYWNNCKQRTINMPRAYLFQSVRNQCAKSFAKKEFTWIEIEQIMSVLPELEQENTLELKEQLLAEIHHVAQELLPQRCLQIFQMRYYQDLSYRQIAQELNITESTVENQINKALRTLRSNTTYKASLYGILLLSSFCIVK